MNEVVMHLESDNVEHFPNCSGFFKLLRESNK